MLQALFYQALQQNGIPPHPGIDPIADGHLHRFTVAGDARDTQNGWYVLYPLGDG